MGVQMQLGFDAPAVAEAPRVDPPKKPEVDASTRAPEPAHEAPRVDAKHEPPKHEDPKNELPKLSAELERLLVHELVITYQQLNGSLFKRRLVPATIRLSNTEERLGQWSMRDRSIELARRLVLGRSWVTVVEVLKHEMAHQYVHEVLGETHESAHGPAFRRLCEELGIDASATGLPKTGDASSDEERVLQRIAKLLALAESPNENEAQAAMTAAQRLMLKYNLESVHASARPYAFRTIGAPTGRTTEHERIVGAILTKHFFVEIVWVPVYLPREGRSASVMEACGRPANLEMAEYVHAFLMHTAEQLWVQHKRAHRIAKNRDRRTFLAGVMMGFYEKLDEGAKQHASQGLVWVKDGNLHSYYRARHPHIQHMRHEGNRRTEAHAHGRAAGRKIVLHKPVGSGPSGGGPKLLGR